MRPNLFSFATSELSQDAMLCWLLAWAHQDCKALDGPLHALGVHVVHRLITLYKEQRGETAPAPGDDFPVKVHRQKFKIDVLALVGDQLALLIEDKVGTAAHSNQLARYREAAEGGWKERQVLCFYVQIGDQSDYGPARKAGYAVVTRPTLLEILRKGLALGVRDNIFMDYLVHLEGIVANVQSWKRAPPVRWSGNAWRGFYVALQAALGQGNWNYVPNPAGGFMGFWWNFKEHPEVTLYLQLEEAQLCVKINVPEKSRRSALRDQWSRRVLAAGRNAGMNWKRPSHFGHGRYMTVAHLGDNYREPDARGLLSWEPTLQRLQAATTFLDDMATPEPHASE